ncbi:hypothetical protein BGX38DRAFT_1268012 [Terfezia claveryi]|nr:hypothetical protein BGX38DRAFT_1268012 [Terfezia claveryi]
MCGTNCIHQPGHESPQALKTVPTASTATVNPESSPLWHIDPNHGMHVGPGILGDAPHSLRAREVFRYYQPPPSLRSSPLSPLGVYTPPSFSDSLTLVNSHDPIIACIANLISRTFDAQRCIITVVANGVSYVLAESTRTLSLNYPHTHAPGDQLWLGAGLALPAEGGLCEHTIALVHPPIGNNEPYLLEIPDLSRHPRYHAGGFVREWPYARFYASSPIRTKAGVSIGTVCIIDDRTRPSGLTREERATLSSFAEVVMDYLERKRESEDERKKQATEIALGRFIAEGFLEEEGEGQGQGSTRHKMLERRDGRVWSVEELEERSRQEAWRRKRVEERRAAFQEEWFAEMVRMERERDHKHREREELEKEDSMRMRKDIKQYHRAREGEIEEPERQTTEVKGDKIQVQSSNDAMTTSITAMELVMEEKPKSWITQARSRKMQPGVIELEHIEGGSDSKQSHELTKAEMTMEQVDLPKDFAAASPMGLDLGDSSALPPAISSIAQWNSHGPLVSPSSTSDTLSYFSTSTQATTAFPASLPLPPTADTIKITSVPAELPQRMSNYEKTTSIESSFRSTFSRAAAWIHDAIDANVVFLDPDLEGLSDDSDSLHNNLDMQVPGDVETLTDMGTTAAAAYISSSPEMESRVRGRRPKWLRRCTGVLAHASSTRGSLSVSHPGSPATCTSHLQNSGFDMAALDERTLAEIAAENRTGGGGSRSKTEEVLPKFLPGVRSAIVVPLVAGEHSTGTMPAAAGDVFAVAVVWTCEETRTFCSEIEGRFVIGVARGIAAEVSRINILNADRAKSEFISSISHELRTPLHGILASAEFLVDLDRLHLDAHLKPFVDTIRSCANTLLETVNHVLEFQKLCATKYQEDNIPTQFQAVDDTTSVSSGDGSNFTLTNKSLQREDPENMSVGSAALVTNLTAPTIDLELPNTTVLGYDDTDLAHFVQDVMESMCLGHNMKGVLATSLFTDPELNQNVAVIIDIPHGAWTFGINRPSLRRIINNLASNAVKYNRPGGWVKVSLNTIKEQDGKARVLLTVADSGKGISREFLKTKLFTPFCQENLLSPGTGLGLSLVRQLVRVLEGRISVTSQKGVGTVVAVVLPVIVPRGTNMEGSDAICGLDETLKGMVQNKRVKFIGFERDKDIGALWQKSSLELLEETLSEYAIGCYGMSITDNVGEADILIAADVGCIDIEGAPKRNIPVISLCTTKPVTGRDGLVTFLRNPIGPMTFTKAVRAAIEQNQVHKEQKNFLSSAPMESVTSSSRSDTQRALEQAQQQGELPEPGVITPMRRLIHMSQLCQNVDSHKPTILVVEDNHINMRLLTTFLARKGYPFSTALNGLEALNYVKANRDNGGYDVILMDLQMPILSGTETTREIRSLEQCDPAFKRAYIIAFTGLAAATDRQDAFLAGVDAFMVKPAMFGALERMWIDHMNTVGEGTRTLKS